MDDDTPDRGALDASGRQRDDENDKDDDDDVVELDRDDSTDTGTGKAPSTSPMFALPTAPPPPLPTITAPTSPAGRLSTVMVMASYDSADDTRVDMAIAEARKESTVSGLGVVHGVPVAMIGRRDALESMVDAYKTVARDRTAHVARIVGESGVGKTRLVLELLETLRLSSYPVSVLTCFGRKAEAHGDVLQRLLARHLQIPGADVAIGDRVEVLKKRVRELFAPTDVAWVHHVLSAFYELPAPALMLREVQALRTDRSALRLAVREVVARLLRHAARSRPVLLWFDDLEYDDAEGLIEVSELLVRLKTLPVLTVFVGEGATIVPVERLAQAEIGQTAIELDRLDADGTEELVRDILRQVEDLPDQLVSMIVRKSQGVPLAVEQLIRLLIDHEVIVTGGVTWSVQLDRLLEDEHVPSTVEDLARLRIQALPDDRRHVLEIAAMIGSPFAFEDLVRMLRLEPMDYDEVPWFGDARATWTQQILLELMGREVIALWQEGEVAASRSLASSAALRLERLVSEAASDSSPTEGAQNLTYFEFRFPSEQRFLLQEADPDLARVIHGCFARLLSARGAEPSRVASHLEAAGLDKEAARRWIEVGSQAEHSFFNHSALDALTHALEFLGPEDGEEYMDLLTSVGRVAMRVGRTGVAETALRTMIQTSFVFEDRRRAIRGYKGLGAAQLASAQHVRSETSFRRMLDLAEQEARPHQVATALDGIARAMYETGAPGACAEAIKLLERALEIRREVGNPRGTARTLEAIGTVCIGRGDLNRAMACFTEAINAQRAVDDWTGLARCLRSLASTCMRLGRLDLAQRHVEEALEVAERTGELAVRMRALITLVELMLRRGGVAATGAAAEYLSAAVALVEQITDRSSQILCLHTRARVRAASGDLIGAWEDARLAVEAAEEGDSVRQLGIALRTLAEIQATMIGERVQPRPSLTDTRDRFLESQRLLEEMGNWHELAATLRAYGGFLHERGKDVESRRCITRAEALDPLTVIGDQGRG